MLVAEELDCEFSSVRFEQAPVDPVYANATMLADAVPFRPDDHGWLASLARHTQFRFAEVLGVQATGGSSSVRDAFPVMRQAGAAARAMLVAAAAKRWGVAPGECGTDRGSVIHAASGRRLGYGELAREAAALPVPTDARTKDPATYRLIGKPQARLDTPAKCDGSAIFGIDVRLPGMLYAAILHCPTFGGSLKSVVADKAMAMAGVKAVINLDCDARPARRRWRWSPTAGGARSRRSPRSRSRGSPGRTRRSTPKASAEATRSCLPAARRAPTRKPATPRRRSRARRKSSRPSTKCPTSRTPRWSR